MIDRLKIPLVTHIMDDWPERLKYKNPVLFSSLDASLRELLKKSCFCLSICDAMSSAFKKLYEVNFIPIANCINPNDWLAIESHRKQRHTSNEPFVIRYTGGLAEDMNFQSVWDVARVVDSLVDEKINIRLEIYTMTRWKAKALKCFRNLRGVSIIDNFLSKDFYRKLLITSDVLLIAYNFDEESIRYVRYSMANKLPEYMASAVPILVYGPLEVQTVSYASEGKFTQIVTERDNEKLRNSILQLVSDLDYGQTLGKKARLLAFDRHNDIIIRKKFHSILLQGVKYKFDLKRKTDEMHNFRKFVNTELQKKVGTTEKNIEKTLTSHNTSYEPVSNKSCIKNRRLLEMSKTMRKKLIEIYQRFAQYLIHNHLTLARIGRFVMYCLRALKRRFFGMGGLSVLTIITLYVGAYANEQHRWILAGSGTGLLLLLMFGLAISYFQFLFLRYANNQHREMRVTANRMGNIDKKILNIQSVLNDLKKEFNRVNENRKAIDHLMHKLADVQTNKANINNLKDGIEQMNSSFDEMIANTSTIFDNLKKELNLMKNHIEEEGRKDRQILNLQSSLDDVHLKTNKLQHKMEHILEIQHMTLSGAQEFLNIPENIKNNTAQYDSFIRKINSSNTVLFQRFNRQLRWEDINQIQKNWLPRLGLTLDAKALGYFAHRICLTEDTCVGRLATGIEDELLRVLVARSVKDQDLEVLEIGTLFGVGIAGIYEICRGIFDNVHITVIDPFEGYYGKNEFDILTRMPVTRDTFFCNMQRMNIPEGQYTVIDKFSTQDEAISEAVKRQYNLLIIDGDHSYSGVKHDFYNYRSMVKRGGYIIFDDYNTSDWPDIKGFVDQEVINLPELQFIGADWRTAVFRVITPFGLVN